MSTESSVVMNTYARSEVCFVRGEGSVLWDSNGKEYLDCLGGLAVVALGHCHPAVTAAIQEQAARLVHVSNLFDNEHHREVAGRLNALLGGGGSVLFQNSGAEANEAAIKLARRFGQLHGGPSRYQIVSTLASFHGRTLMTLAATGQPSKQETFAPMPEGFRHVPFGDIDALTAALTDEVAAVLIEPLQAEGGVNVPPPGYLTEVRRVCDEREVVLMFDEVQTGLGRTGFWFGHQAAGIRPDIVTMAKALGNGMPIGAMWARNDIAAVLRPGDHGTTFGGQPLATAAARAVLETLEGIDAPQLATHKGAALARRLEHIPGVASVRGAGLLLAAELGKPIAAEVARACLDRGLVVNAVTPSAIRFTPALTISDEQLEQAAAMFAAALASLETGSEPSETDGGHE